MTLRVTLLRLRDEELLTRAEMAERLNLTCKVLDQHIRDLPAMSAKTKAARKRRARHLISDEIWRNRGYDPTPPPKDELIALRERGWAKVEIAKHYAVPEGLVTKWALSLPNLSEEALSIIRQRFYKHVQNTPNRRVKAFLSEDAIAELYRGRRYDQRPRSSVVEMA